MRIQDKLFSLIYGWRLFKRISFSSGSYIRGHSIIRTHGGNISLGKKVRIYPYSRIQCCSKNSSISFGDKTFIAYRFTCLCKDNIKIGKNCLIASDVFMSDYNHNTNFEEGFNELKSKPIEIGNNVWIGEKSIILPGVTIGNNCIIGAGSVVSKSIPEYCLAVGNPARIIKKYDQSNKVWIKINNGKGANL